MIEYIFHRKRHGKPSKYWTGRYSLARSEKPRQIALDLTDEAAARAKLHEVVVEAQREAYGLIPKKSLREAAGTALSTLLDEYRADLLAQSRAPNHVRKASPAPARLSVPASGGGCGTSRRRASWPGAARSTAPPKPSRNTRSA
jgi:hypothetical protein